MKNKVFAASLIIILALSMMFAGCDSPFVQQQEDSGSYDRGLEALQQADYEAAVREFEAAADKDERYAESYRGIGMVYYAKNEYEEAVTYFDMALKSQNFENEEFTQDIKFYKADALAQLGNTEEAQAIYEELTEGLRPGMAMALIGRIYLEDGNEMTAKVYFGEAVEAEPDLDIYLLIYDACRENGLDNDGRAYLEKALLLEPETAKDHKKLGRIYDYIGEPARAKEMLNKAIEMGDTDAVSILGQVLLEEEDVSGAKDMYREALEQGADTAKCYNGLAVCALKENDPDTALKYIEEGLKYDNGLMKRSLLFNEIAAYEQKLDFETAESKMAAFLKLYPGDEAAKREYKFLINA